MITRRHAEDRGHTNLGWLDSYHTFSFGRYYNPEFMGYSKLRVLNDDKVLPGAGFATHAHRDMEIVSYVLEGALEHRDSMGNGSVIRPGDVQRMSAGTGVTHSEYNASTQDSVHFLQIWLEPNQIGIRPGYEQKTFTPEDRSGRLVLLVSPDGREESVTSHQDGLIYGAVLDAGQRVVHTLLDGRNAYIHVARGSADVNGEVLNEGDGAAIRDLHEIGLEGIREVEVLLFDMP